MSEEYRYELRIVDGVAYNSHADVSFFYFKNGIRSSVSPAGHSDVRNFPEGTVVVCRLKKAEEEKGYFIEGLAEVTKFSKKGRPTEFGHTINNRVISGRWIEPGPDTPINDARE